jgi:hypothetical protein
LRDRPRRSSVDLFKTFNDLKIDRRWPVNGTPYAKPAAVDELFDDARVQPLQGAGALPGGKRGLLLDTLLEMGQPGGVGRTGMAAATRAVLVG